MVKKYSLSGRACLQPIGVGVLIGVAPTAYTTLAQTSRKVRALRRHITSRLY